MTFFSGLNPLEPDTFSFLAADMGTTNIVVSNGITSVRLKNPQTKYGSDIISRILFSMKNDPSLLTSSLHKGLLDAFSLFYETYSALPGNTGTGSFFPVKNIVLTGNTVMMHFLSGLDVSSLSSFPFKPLSLFNIQTNLFSIFPNIDYTAWSHLFSPETTVYLPPCVDAFLGGDLVCAAAGCGLYGSFTAVHEESFSNAVQSSSPRIVIDIGTNTEILLSHKGLYYAASTAAGPAFEGGMIKSSLRGSELLNALSIMLHENQMDSTGMLLQERSLLCQSDIRLLQLAKSAICAAVKTLLHEASLRDNEIDEVFLCGAFGSNCRPEDIERTGLLPSSLARKITMKEHAVIEGSRILGISTFQRDICFKQIQNTSVIQLADSSFFAREYISCMNF